MPGSFFVCLTFDNAMRKKTQSFSYRMKRTKQEKNHENNRKSTYRELNFIWQRKMYIVIANLILIGFMFENTFTGCLATQKIIKKGEEKKKTDTKFKRLPCKIHEMLKVR